MKKAASVRYWVWRLLKRRIPSCRVIVGRRVFRRTVAANLWRQAGVLVVGENDLGAVLGAVELAKSPPGYVASLLRLDGSGCLVWAFKQAMN
jgi:hypothetical protein